MQKRQEDRVHGIPFEGKRDGQLTIRKRQALLVNDDIKDWSRVETLNGQKGRVPSNYVKEWTDHVGRQGAQARALGLHGMLQFSTHLPSRAADAGRSAYHAANAVAGVAPSTSV